MNPNKQETRRVSTPERILGRKLARELSQDELRKVFGGHDPGPGETCSGSDCDVAK